MGIKNKELKILWLLREKPYTIKELAERVGLSDRNLRYSLDDLEFYLKKVLNREINKNNKKVSVFLTQKEIETFLCYAEESYVYSSTERQEYLLNYFLFDRAINIKKISEVLEVSRPTLKKDIESLNKEISVYSLNFKLEQNKMIIGGNEKKLRNLMMLKMEKYISSIDNKKILDKKIKKLIEKIYYKYFEEVLEYVDEIEDLLGGKFSKEFKKLISYYLIVTLYRVDLKEYIIKKHNEDFLKDTQEFLEVKKILSKRIPVELGYEFLHLTEYFLSGSTKDGYYEERIEIELFTYGLLRHIKKNLKMEFAWEETFSEVTGYLKSAIYRMKNNFLLYGEKEVEVNTMLGLEIEKICEADDFLSESLRVEEIRALENIITSEATKREKKVISYDELLKIIKSSTLELNTKKLYKRIFQEFGDYVYLESRDQIPYINLNKEVIIKRDADDVEGMKLDDFISFNLIKNPLVSCYYYRGNKDLELGKIKVYVLREQVIILLFVGNKDSYLRDLYILKEKFQSITKYELDKIKDI